MSKDDYKLGSIRATSAIISNVPLGRVKPKRTKLKLIMLAVIMGYIGYAVYSSSASANDNEVVDSTLITVIDEMLRDRADNERKKFEICRKLDQKIADKLIRKIDRPNFSPLESELNLIEAWEGYCKGRVFDKDLIRKSHQYEHDDKKDD